jgi:hypothetical protein
LQEPDAPAAWLFSMLFGKNVSVGITDSILLGGQRCRTTHIAEKIQWSRDDDALTIAPAKNKISDVAAVFKIQLK